MGKNRKNRKNRKNDPRVSRQVYETGEWVEAQKGQIFAPGTYVDSKGVLRDSSDASVVTWHSTERIRATQGLAGRCERKGLEPSDVVYDPDTGAPWCPDCWPVETARRLLDGEKDKVEGLKSLFGDN